MFVIYLTIMQVYNLERKVLIQLQDKTNDDKCKVRYLNHSHRMTILVAKSFWQKQLGKYWKDIKCKFEQYNQLSFKCLLASS